MSATPFALWLEVPHPDALRVVPNLQLDAIAIEAVSHANQARVELAELQVRADQLTTEAARVLVDKRTSRSGVCSACGGAESGCPCSQRCSHGAAMAVTGSCVRRASNSVAAPPCWRRPGCFWTFPRLWHRQTSTLREIRGGAVHSEVPDTVRATRSDARQQWARGQQRVFGGIPLLPVPPGAVESSLGVHSHGASATAFAAASF